MEETGTVGSGQSSALAPAKFRGLLKPGVVVGLLAVMVVGLLTGRLLAGQKTLGPGSGGTGVIPQGRIVAGGEYGAEDITTFKDQALGVLEKGGLNGEGTHQLLREGGPSQTVYLTSSVVDLDQFAGRKVQIWGETFKGQKAGWLMDVGRLKVLE